MSLINTFLQASSVLMNSQNSQWQREREYERGLTALEVEKMRQEQQLKMTYLQQELQQNAREQDRIRQAELRGAELINQADLDKAKIRDSERYLRGTWKEAHFGSEQPPYVIFCINPLQDLNQFKDELARIAPFQRTYDNFKTRNGAYVGRLFSTITISETFKSEAEARAFFYRELNCPCIIVYGIFTGTGFGIYALTAGMSPEQLRIDGQKVADWGLRIEKLWDISYNTIHGIKQRATDDAIKQLKKKAAETGLTLPTDPELLRQKAVELRGRFDVLEGLELYTDTHVGLCVQVMLDNYFSYYPRQVYEIKTPAFLEAKQKELTRLGIWEALKNSLLERYEVLKGRQSLKIENQKDVIQNDSFIAFDPKSLTKNVSGEWICNNLLDGKTVKPFTFHWVYNNLPSFSSNLLRLVDDSGKIGFINSDGKVVIPFEYEAADEVREGYVAVRKNGKWGLLDCQGNLSISFDYHSLSSPIEGFVRFVLVDEVVAQQKNIIKNLNIESGLPYVAVGLMDTQGAITLIVSSDYHRVYPIIRELEDGFIILTKGYLQEGVIDINGRILIPIDAEEVAYLGEGCFLVKKDNKDLFFNLREGIKSKLDKVSLAKDLESTSLFAEYLPEKIQIGYNNSQIQRCKSGIFILNIYYLSSLVCKLLIDQKGATRLLKMPSESEFQGKRHYYSSKNWEYAENIIKAENIYQESFYFSILSYFEYPIEDFNSIKTSHRFHKIGEKFSNGMAAVREENGWGFINTDFNNVIPCQYEYVEPFSEELSFVKINKQHYSLIDKKGTVILDFLPNHYQKGVKFKNGFACICLYDKTDYEKSTPIREWAIINKEGKILVM